MVSCLTRDGASASLTIGGVALRRFELGGPTIRDTCNSLAALALLCAGELGGSETPIEPPSSAIPPQGTHSPVLNIPRRCMFA